MINLKCSKESHFTKVEEAPEMHSTLKLKQCPGMIFQETPGRGMQTSLKNKTFAQGS